MFLFLIIKLITAKASDSCISPSSLLSASTSIIAIQIHYRVINQGTFKIRVWNGYYLGTKVIDIPSKIVENSVFHSIQFN